MGDDEETTSDSNTPDGGYGWICVIAAFVINAFTWGQVSVSQQAFYFLLKAIYAILSFASYTVFIFFTIYLTMTFLKELRWTLHSSAVSIFASPCSWPRWPFL